MTTSHHRPRRRRPLPALLGAFVAATALACPVEPYPDDPGPEGQVRPGDCTSLGPLGWNGVQGCWPIGPFAQQVVDELVTVWGTAPGLICSYGPFDGRVGACGPLSPGNATYCALDNVIAWDLDFMNGQYARHGDFAPVAIIAHEWGHRNQALTGLVGPHRSTFRNEQHADCQAGIFAAVAESRGYLQMGDVMEAFSSLCQAAGPSGWFDPSSHGTCAERVAAFQHGYLNGRAQLVGVCGPAPLDAMLTICAN